MTASLLGHVGTAGQDPEGNAYTSTALNALLVGTTTNTALQVGTNSAVHATMLADGRIGFGTASPTSQLDVLSDTYPVTRITRSLALGTGSAGTLELRRSFIGGTFSANSSLSLNFWMADDNGSRNLASISALATSTSPAESGALILNTNNGGGIVEQARLTSGGALGIGEASPQRTIHATSGTTAAMRLEDSAGTATDVKSWVEGYSGATNAWLVGMNTSSATMTVSNLLNGPLNLRTNGATHLTVTPLGEVGIGTTGPGAKLEVLSGNFPVARVRRTTTATGGIGTTVECRRELTSGTYVAGFGVGLDFYLEDTATSLQAASIRAKAANASPDDTAALVFATNTGAGLTEQAEIDDNGALVSLVSGALGLSASRWSTLFAGTADLEASITVPLQSVFNSGASASGLRDAGKLGVTTTASDSVADYGPELLLDVDLNGTTKTAASIAGTTDGASSSGTYDGRLRFLARSEFNNATLEAMTVGNGVNTTHGELLLEAAPEASSDSEDLDEKGVVVTARASVAVSQYDAVAIDTTDGTSGEFNVRTTTTASSKEVFGVAQEAITSGQTGRVMIVGVTQVNCSSNVDIGEALVTTTTAGEVTSTGSPAAGAVLGKALSDDGTPVTGRCWAIIGCAT